MSVVLEARNKGGVSLSVILLEIFPAALAVLLLAAVGVLHVTSRVMVVKLGYEVSRLDARSVEVRVCDAPEPRARDLEDRAFSSRPATLLRVCHRASLQRKNLYSRACTS